MLRDGEIDTKVRLGQDKMAADLSNGAPASLLKGLGGFFAREVGEFPLPSNRNDNGLLSGFQGLVGNRFLIFSPQPSRDGFLDVCQSLFLVPSL